MERKFSTFEKPHEYVVMKEGQIAKLFLQDGENKTRQIRIKMDGQSDKVLKINQKVVSSNTSDTETVYHAAKDGSTNDLLKLILEGKSVNERRLIITIKKL